MSKGLNFTTTTHDTVPERLLQGFEVLKVFNLTGTCIRSLPLSLFQLGDLRTLILRNCFSLEELPPLGGLSKFQMLNLCATRIKELPSGMEKLSNLRQLDLSHTDSLKTIHIVHKCTIATVTVACAFNILIIFSLSSPFLLNSLFLFPLCT